MDPRESGYGIEFYRAPNGVEPAARFIDRLEAHKRAALVAALECVLASQGVGVVGTEFGKPLGKGLYEFRLRHTYDEIVSRYPGLGAATGPSARRGDRVLLRVFFHPWGNRLILLLAGYDKGRDASPQREDREIARARKYLADFKRNSRG